MKVVCVDDKFEVSTGLFSSKMVSTGELTMGKTYEVTSAISAYIGSSGGSIGGDDNEFLLFNEKGEWNTYNTKRFKPV